MQFISHTLNQRNLITHTFFPNSGLQLLKCEQHGATTETVLGSPSLSVPVRPPSTRPQLSIVHMKISCRHRCVELAPLNLFFSPSLRPETASQGDPEATPTSLQTIHARADRADVCAKGRGLSVPGAFGFHGKELREGTYHHVYVQVQCRSRAQPRLHRSDRDVSRAIIV